MRRTACALLTVAGLAVAAAAQEAAPPAPAQPAEKSVWDQILELYESAKESGQQVPQDVWEWLREDVQSMGDWEYRVLEMASGVDAATIETRLNELGVERWECIWIQPSGARTRFFLKRPRRSYVQQIPLNQLLKLLPGSDSSG